MRSKVSLMSDSLNSSYGQRAKGKCHANDEWLFGNSPMSHDLNIDSNNTRMSGKKRTPWLNVTLLKHTLFVSCGLVE